MTDVNEHTWLTETLDRMVANAKAHERTTKMLDGLTEMLLAKKREMAEWDKGYAHGFEAGRRSVTCWDLVRQWLSSWFKKKF